MADISHPHGGSPHAESKLLPIFHYIERKIMLVAALLLQQIRWKRGLLCDRVSVSNFPICPFPILSHLPETQKWSILTPAMNVCAFLIIPTRCRPANHHPSQLTRPPFQRDSVSSLNNSKSASGRSKSRRPSLRDALVCCFLFCWSLDSIVSSKHRPACA